MTDEKLYGICLTCGRSHDPENRLRLIRLMFELDVPAIAAAWPCFYPPTSAGERMIHRDRAAIRAGR